MWVVSWLRAASLAFPVVLTSGEMSEANYLPVTVAGPRRHFTGFRIPHSTSIVRRAEMRDTGNLSCP